jgi:hypothetical protein
MIQKGSQALLHFPHIWLNETSYAAGAPLKVLYRKSSQNKMLQNAFKVILKVYQTQSVHFFVVTQNKHLLLTYLLHGAESFLSS